MILFGLGAFVHLQKRIDTTHNQVRTMRQSGNGCQNSACRCGEPNNDQPLLGTDMTKAIQDMINASIHASERQRTENKDIQALLKMSVTKKELDKSMNALEESIKTVLKKGKEARTTRFEALKESVSQVDGRINGVNSRLENVIGSLTTRFQALEGSVSQVDGRIDGVNSRLDNDLGSLTTRFQALEGSVSRVDGRINGVNSRLDNDIGSLTTRFEALKESFSQVDGRINGVNSRLNNDIGSLTTRFEDAVDGRINALTNVLEKEIQGRAQFTGHLNTVMGNFATKLGELEQASATASTEISTLEQHVTFRSGQLEKTIESKLSSYVRALGEYFEKVLKTNETAHLEHIQAIQSSLDNFMSRRQYRRRQSRYAKYHLNEKPRLTRHCRRIPNQDALIRATRQYEQAALANIQTQQENNDKIMQKLSEVISAINQGPIMIQQADQSNHPMISWSQQATQAGDATGQMQPFALGGSNMTLSTSAADSTIQGESHLYVQAGPSQLQIHAGQGGPVDCGGGIPISDTAHHQVTLADPRNIQTFNQGGQVQANNSVPINADTTDRLKELSMTPYLANWIDQAKNAGLGSLGGVLPTHGPHATPPTMKGKETMQASQPQQVPPSAVETINGAMQGVTGNLGMPRTPPRSPPRQDQNNGRKMLIEPRPQEEMDEPMEDVKDSRDDESKEEDEDDDDEEEEEDYDGVFPKHNPYRDYRDGDHDPPPPYGACVQT